MQTQVTGLEQSPNVMQHGLIDMNTVAEQLHCSRRHVERLLASERLPTPVRVGRLVRWRADEVREWIAAGCPNRDKWNAMRTK